jgi:hypothetical protein
MGIVNNSCFSGNGGITNQPADIFAHSNLQYQCAVWSGCASVDHLDISRIAIGCGHLHAVVEFPLGYDVVIRHRVYGAVVFFTRFIFVFSKYLIVCIHGNFSGCIQFWQLRQK